MFLDFNFQFRSAPKNSDNLPGPHIVILFIPIHLYIPLECKLKSTCSPPQYKHVVAWLWLMKRVLLISKCI